MYWVCEEAGHSTTCYSSVPRSKARLLLSAYLSAVMCLRCSSCKGRAGEDCVSCISDRTESCSPACQLSQMPVLCYGFRCPPAGAGLQREGSPSQSWALLIWGRSHPDWTVCDPQPPWLAASLLTFCWCPCRIWRKGRRPGLAHACRPLRKGHLRPPSIWLPESDVSETGKHGDRVSPHQFTSNVYQLM